ncbi:uncharacterized protein LOC108160340 [Drosophila miranda]|uniref:uncharacterized protein LOC108160340 n=1 Tax=Drosophila miranda TaxID=7229 RepID=UPI0007E7CCD0|nr:uncharacterized protein LOC108160340 [Drosophila miranda]
MFRLLRQTTQQVAKGGLMWLQRATALRAPVRSFGDDDCKPDVCVDKPVETRCGPPSLRKPCEITPEKKEEPKDLPKPPKPFKSMWDIEGCPPIVCQLPSRYDIKYYRVSDKEKRKYQVTWNDCPRMVVKPRKVCLYETMVRPKPCRRKRKVNPKEGAPPMQNSLECIKKEDSNCRRITMPCCKPARIPPTCKAALKGLSGCKKRNAPYPSFSECKKGDLLELPPTECKCLEAFAMCEAWAVLRRRLALGKGPAKKCGEA